MKTGIIIQARMGSTRLPGKVLMPLPPGQTEMLALDWTIRACLETGFPVVVATSTNDEDVAIVRHVEERWIIGARPLPAPNVSIFRGDPIDVLDRMYRCAVAHEFDEVVRITGDCPFVDPDVIRQVVALRHWDLSTYASNVDPPTWPDGLDVQCVGAPALATAHERATDPTDRDTVLQYIVHRREEFSVSNLPCPVSGMERYRAVLDTMSDYEECSRLARWFQEQGITVPRLVDLMAAFDAVAIDPRGGRNERYLSHRTKELANRSFDNSAAILRYARRVQPYGASTYSKSFIAWGEDAPLYTTHARGSRVWDVDGNEYIDFTGGLGGSVILGYADPTVRDAVIQQMDRGNVSPLAHELEHRAAAMVLSHVVGTHTVGHDRGYKLVWGKNGSDVTSAAVRVARVYTGRTDDGVIALTSGYHGWHDWALYRTPRGHGIPDCGTYRTDDGLQWVKQILTSDRPPAAVIVEPNQFAPDGLRALIEGCRAAGTLVIFDEMVTFGRYEKGTYAKSFDLDPDLICLGKGLGNGIPVTCLIGKADIMDKFSSTDGSPYAFYSGTHFGDGLGFAAAYATVSAIRGEGQKHICDMQWSLWRHLNKLLQDDFPMMFTAETPPFCTMRFRTEERAAQFRREMTHNGILVWNRPYAMLAHSEDDLAHFYEAAKASLHAIIGGTARGAPTGAGIMRS